MATEIGTATDFKDLLDKLRIFLTSHPDLVSASQQWVQERWINGAGDHELSVRGPGLSGTDNIFVNIMTESDVAQDYFHWRAYGATSFNALRATDDQVGQSGGPSCVLLWNTAIPYWLFATGRYFIVIAKVQNVYESYYGGFGKPTTDDPLEYPYPFYSGGSHYSRNTRFSSESADHRSFWDPGLRGGWLRDPAGIWREVSNVYGTGSGNKTESVSSVLLPRIAPYHRPANVADLGNIDTSLGGMDAFDVDGDGDYTLFDILIHRLKTTSPVDDGGRYMYLDGVAAISGVAQASENTILVDGDTWHIFSTSFRSDTHDYVAIKEV